MNKNMIYVAVLAALCVLAGVVVGAGIAKRANLPWRCQERPNFSERAERFMRRGPGERDGKGLLEMLVKKLGLTKDQQVKVNEVLEKTRQEIDEVGKNVRNTIIEIKEKGDREIMEVLTLEQQQKFKALIDEFKKRCDQGTRERCHGPMGGKHGE